MRYTCSVLSGWIIQSAAMVGAALQDIYREANAYLLNFLISSFNCIDIYNHYSSYEQSKEGIWNVW